MEAASPPQATLRFPVALGAGTGAVIGGRSFAPDPTAAAKLPAPIWVVAMPGGAASWRYFDMRVPGRRAGEYSFAAFMARRGVGTVAIDTLGIGESEFPFAIEQLTLEAIASANHQAAVQVRQRLTEGTLAAQVPPDSSVVLCGVGHSGGAGATMIQQSLHRSYDAVALFGMPADDFKMYGDGEATAHDVMKPNDRGLLTMESRPPASRRAGFAPDTPDDVIEAFLGTLPVPPSMTAFTKNGVLAPHAAAITCPVFVGFGEMDLAGSPLLEAGRYARSPDTTVCIQPGARHNHFAANTRFELMTTLFNWLWSRARDG